MNLTKSFFLIGLAGLTALLLIAGCGPQMTQTPTLSSAYNYQYKKRLDISIETDRHKHKPVPTLTVLPVGSLKGVTIIVDAGHGGKDPGAGEKTYSRTPEKTINLAIAKELQTRLKAKGARVIMSRTTDRFIDLDVRAAMPGKYKAHILVSIHADSNPSRYLNGVCVYVARNRSYKSFKTADNIKASVINSGIAFHKIGNRDFRVLAKHSKPAVLVECGYMTNRTDAKNLNNSWYRKKLATAIANGIANSF